MLTTRNVIAATVAVAVLSVLSGVLSLAWNEPSHNTFGRDSFGTRADGQRAAYELLEELKFEVERSLIPSAAEDAEKVTYVVWNPLDSLVQVEPAHLQVLANWVRSGGRLVVSSGPEADSPQTTSCRRCSSTTCTDCIPISLFQELGLTGVSIQEFASTDPKDGESSLEEDFSDKDVQDRDFEDFRRSVKQAFETKVRTSALYAMDCTGTFGHLSSQVMQVRLPADQNWVVEYGELEPAGIIRAEDSHGEVYTIGAEFSVEKGQIIVISNPHLASNQYLGSEDNSVLLTHLLTGQRPRVIFDEFYHGLTMRGNALWLLSQPPYAAMALSILAVVGLWVWRESIFLGPCQEERRISRRTLNEYIEAMSRFLMQGRESPRYVLREVRDGLLWSYSKELGLPPQQHDAETIISLLTKRQPRKAEQLKQALQSANDALDSSRLHNDMVLQAIRKVSDCHSKIPTERSEAK